MKYNYVLGGLISTWNIYVVIFFVPSRYNPGIKGVLYYRIGFL